MIESTNKLFSSWLHIPQLENIEETILDTVNLSLIISDKPHCKS